MRRINAKAFKNAPSGDAVIAAYEAIRPKLKTCDLLLCSGDYAFSKIIRKATSSDWSHVALIVQARAIGRVLVLESVEPEGVRVVPFRKYLLDYKDGKAYPGGIAVASLKAQPNISDRRVMSKFGQQAVDLFGYPYDRDQVLKLALRVAQSTLFGANAGAQDFDNDKEFICSEYVAICLRELGLGEIAPGPHGFVAPVDFVPLLTDFKYLKRPG
tara:strand:+ start:100 stop:741 length:642 start_codon:yes stop_codon:yes gene_type:complete